MVMWLLVLFCACNTLLQVNRTPGKDVDEVTYHGDSVEKAIGNSHVAVCYRKRW